MIKYYGSEDCLFILKETEDSFEIAEEGKGIIAKFDKKRFREFK
jgi:hypothetical protein